MLRFSVGLRGFEPRQTEPKSVVLPLYYRPILFPVWGRKNKTRFFITQMEFKAFLNPKSAKNLFTGAVKQIWLYGCLLFLLIPLFYLKHQPPHHTLPYIRRRVYDCCKCIPAPRSHWQFL
jgi:hypothetical protein